MRAVDSEIENQVNSLYFVQFAYAVTTLASAVDNFREIYTKIAHVPDLDHSSWNDCISMRRSTKFKPISDVYAGMERSIMELIVAYCKINVLMRSFKCSPRTNASG